MPVPEVFSRFNATDWSNLRALAVEARPGERMPVQLSVGWVDFERDASGRNANVGAVTAGPGGAGEVKYRRLPLFLWPK